MSNNKPKVGDTFDFGVLLIALPVGWLILAGLFQIISWEAVVFTLRGGLDLMPVSVLVSLVALVMSRKTPPAVSGFIMIPLVLIALPLATYLYLYLYRSALPEDVLTRLSQEFSIFSILLGINTFANQDELKPSGA
jgi:hypothetical protein